MLPPADVEFPPLLVLTSRSAAAAAEAEVAGVLDEEVALFRKEQAETRQVHLLLIDLDLREIGAIRGVEQ